MEMRLNFSPCVNGEPPSDGKGQTFSPFKITDLWVKSSTDFSLPVRQQQVVVRRIFSMGDGEIRPDSSRISWSIISKLKIN